MEELLWVSGSLAGDMEAFRRLFEDYHARALRTAYLITGRRDLAEDAVQEAFVLCYRKLPSLRHPEAFSVWFYRILVNVCRRIASRKKKVFPLEDHLLENQSVVPDNQIPEEIVTENETSAEIRRALSKLNPHLRTAIILYYYNHMSVQEIARVLQCFEGTVKSRLYNARRLLRQQLEPYVMPEGKECMSHA